MKFTDLVIGDTVAIDAVRDCEPFTIQGFIIRLIPANEIIDVEEARCLYTHCQVNLGVVRSLPYDRAFIKMSDGHIFSVGDDVLFLLRKITIDEMDEED